MPIGRTQRKARKLDRAKVVELAEQGLKTVDIAKHQGVAPSTIFRFLQQTEPDRLAVEGFKKDRGDVFARLSMKSLDVQEKIVETFDDALISTLKPHEKGSLLHALNIQAGTLYDKERLERGQSTSNQSILARFLQVSVDELTKQPAQAKVILGTLKAEPTDNTGSGCIEPESEQP